MSTVFGCLASAVGVKGCGFEHQLQALNFAFNLKGNESQWDFLRSNAYLGIVILSDEDDCSAPPDTLMFKNSIANESWSLRCATRGHMCENTNLEYPTTGALEKPFASCTARMDATCSGVDTSEPTSCTPLMSIEALANAVKALKGGGAQADEKILVAGIFGWPREGDNDRPYKIAKIPNPTTGAGAPAEVFEYWPICYDPDHMPSSSGYDKEAADYGAYGGLRIKAFLDQFVEKSRKAFSICEKDFGPAMTEIGKALAAKLKSLCVPYKLADSNTDTTELDPDCRVVDRIPEDKPDPNDSNKTITVYNEASKSMPHCDSSQSVKPCWDLDLTDSVNCPATDTVPSQKIEVARETGTSLTPGTKVGMQCVTCIEPAAGVLPIVACRYCSGDAECGQGNICNGGWCVKQKDCDSDDQCGEGNHCNNGNCGR